MQPSPLLADAIATGARQSAAIVRDRARRAASAVRIAGRAGVFAGLQGQPGVLAAAGLFSCPVPSRLIHSSSIEPCHSALTMVVLYPRVARERVRASVTAARDLFSTLPATDSRSNDTNVQMDTR